jgi:hypothetical protein
MGEMLRRVRLLGVLLHVLHDAVPDDDGESESDADEDRQIHHDCAWHLLIRTTLLFVTKIVE